MWECENVEMRECANVGMRECGFSRFRGGKKADVLRKIPV